MVMQELPRPKPCFVLKRGAYDTPAEPVTADTPVGHAASVVKLGRNRATQAVARLKMEAGGYAAMEYDPQAIRGEAPLPERDYLFRMAPDYFDSRKVTIAGGSTEIQKDLVARRMLGL